MPRVTQIDRRAFLLAAGAALALPGCGRGVAGAAAEGESRMRASPKAARLIAAARGQIGVTTGYDAAYTVLGYPGGDVPRARGVCTDVVIRAYRDAFALDLQALVHADMAKAFGAYPHAWGLTAPDASIDHRRVPNLRTWFTRHHGALPIPTELGGWQPGDVFTSLIEGHSTHIGLVSDRRGAKGPLIIHNIGAGTREEDALGDWPLTGRYRWALA
jgi:uncharacterized protein YijF (DUF1287 family)